MQVQLAKYAGFCYGVRRAVEMAEKCAAEGGKVYTAGPIIHNKYTIKDLGNKGVITCKNVCDVPSGAQVIVRAHGLTKEDILILQEKECNVIDATCPNVLQIHKIVTEESEKGRAVLILGASEHPEVQGIKSRAQVAYVVGDERELDDFIKSKPEMPISVVAQTTLKKELFVNSCEKLKNAFTNVVFFDTICMATYNRQNEIDINSDKYESVVVIGDKESSNSRKLWEIAEKHNKNVQFIEDLQELDMSKLDTDKSVFLAAGASTPDLIIKEVQLKMENENKVLTGESFEELLEQSFKTLHTGEKVTGIVTDIKATDVHVNLGVKQDGYIPRTEMSDDPTYVVEDHIKVGDEIEAFVVRVNDVEGMIMLSKKRLDSVKNWELVETACENKTPMEGIIVDQNKGGVVASVLGVRVFIPASQTGLGRDVSFDTIMKTKQKLLVTEVNRQKRRVVGSIRILLSDSRREAETKVWETIAVGDKFEGTVKSFTTYGAFVDIGGVDGMVHISELAWSRVKHPSDVLELGQKINVYVIALDAEKKKISLGYRLPSDNPWNKFVEKYAADDVIKVKVVKFMPFGAFAEIMPGVDGLIHISQISQKHIEKAEEVLKIGQEVEVKITEIDLEKKKISLSIRVLAEDMARDAEPEGEQAETITE